MPKTIADLEQLAAGEADDTANARVTDGWVRVVHKLNDGEPSFGYFHDVGRKQFPLSRAEAQDLLRNRSAK